MVPDTQDTKPAALHAIMAEVAALVHLGDLRMSLFNK